MNFVNGETLYLLKPLHWTSFDLVRKLRNRLTRKSGLKKLKVGHAGTLDPLATGVMIVCTGKSTKLIESFQYQTKEYVATLQLGATTPSFDLETAVDAVYSTQGVDREKILEILPQFMGSIMQIPPAFSACKVDGKRAYQMARAGIEVALKAKELVIDQIELISFEQPTMQIVCRIVCSKGTYIRALARDIGAALGCGAHLIALDRTRIGEISSADCLTIEQFESLLEVMIIDLEFNL